MTDRSIHVLSADKRPATWHVEHNDGAPWQLALVAEGGTRYDATGQDLFDCLRQIRRQTDRAGILLCCNGARRNVRPSGLSSELGALGVYKLHRWRAPLPGDLVDTFDYAAPRMIATVEEQEAYRLKVDKYRRSLLGLANPIMWLTYGYSLAAGRLRDYRARRRVAKADRARDLP